MHFEEDKQKTATATTIKQRNTKQQFSILMIILIKTQNERSPISVENLIE